MKKKKFLIALLYAFIFLFANVKTEAYAEIGIANNKSLAKNIEDTIIVKIENDVEEEQKRIEEEQRRLEEEQKERERANIVQTSVTYEDTYSYAPSITYGTYGRLYVSWFNVALYDYNVYTNSGSSLQQLVDNYDSAAFYTSRNRLVIADHDTQGFSVLTGLYEGATSYIQFEDESTIGYRLIKKAKGYNTGPDLIDTEGNSFFNMDSDLIMYTCYDGGIMVTLWSLL